MNKIYVGNLPFSTSEDALREMFSSFGDITEIALIRDRYSNDFKGFGFITYAMAESAQASLSMDGKDFGGRPMKVSIAREPEKRSGGAGGGAGRGGHRGGHGGGGHRSGGGFGGGHKKY